MCIEYIDLNFAKLEQIEFEKLNRCNKNMTKKGRRGGRERTSHFCFIVGALHGDTSKSYVKRKLALSQSRFSFQSDKRKVFEGFFFIPRFLFISTRQDFRYPTPVTFHENYIYICQKCPPALSFARYDVDKWSISLDTRLNH